MRGVVKVKPASGGAPRGEFYSLTRKLLAIDVSRDSMLIITAKSRFIGGFGWPTDFRHQSCRFAFTGVAARELGGRGASAHTTAPRKKAKWSSTLPWKRPRRNALVAGFEKKYPFVKVDATRIGSERMATRLIAEAQARKVRADVVHQSAFDFYGVLQKGLFDSYLSRRARRVSAGVSRRQRVSG